MRKFITICLCIIFLVVFGAVGAYADENLHGEASFLMAIMVCLWFMKLISKNGPDEQG